MIAEAQTILATTALPEAPSERACELLTAAVSLADELLAMRNAQRRFSANQEAAAKLGKKGGKETAKRGPEYFRKIAAMRKEHKGGRPRQDQ